MTHGDPYIIYWIDAVAPTNSWLDEVPKFEGDCLAIGWVHATEDCLTLVDSTCGDAFGISHQLPWGCVVAARNLVTGDRIENPRVVFLGPDAPALFVPPTGD